jgi:acetyltransferase-like isoleucine patch superfamily enzyme
MRKIHPTAIIYEGVELPTRIFIGAYCVIGYPKNGENPKMTTSISEGANIRSHTIIYEGNKIGQGFSTGHHVCIREENTIGDNVSIGTLTCIEHHIEIGSNSRIHSQVFIPEFSVLHEDSWLGPNVVLTNAKYPRSRDVKENLKGPTIGKNAIIGANTTVLPARLVGRDSLIGAGALVSKDVKEGSVVIGNPAKEWGNKKDIEEYQ